MPNTSTLTGLTASTEYVLDAVHVDAWGNVSAVVSSDAFTAAAPAATDFAFVDDAFDAATATTYTFDSADLGAMDFSAGGKFLVVVHSYENSGDFTLPLATGVTIGGATGVAATPGGGYPSPVNNVFAAPSAWVATVSAGANEEIVVEAPAGASWPGCAVSLYRIDGYNARAVVCDWSTGNPKTISISTESGSPVIAATNGHNIPAVDTFSAPAPFGSVDAFGDLDVGEAYGVWSLAAAAATETADFTFDSANGNTRYALTLVSLEVA